MKTTIDVPEDLLRRAKVTAIQRRTSLKSLVVRGLEIAVRQPESNPEREKSDRAAKLLSALQASNAKPMKPLARAAAHRRRN